MLRKCDKRPRAAAQSKFCIAKNRSIDVRLMSAISSIDFLIVGAGFSGLVTAERLTNAGFRCVVIDQRDHLGGNAYDCYDEAGVLIHPYGPHYFARIPSVSSIISHALPSGIPSNTKSKVLPVTNIGASRSISTPSRNGWGDHPPRKNGALGWRKQKLRSITHKTQKRSL